MRRGSKYLHGSAENDLYACEVHFQVRMLPVCVVQLRHRTLANRVFLGETLLSAPSLQAAIRLLDQRLSLDPITDLPEAMRPQTEAEGYALQRVLNGLLTIARLGRQVGHKIGCTTVMQNFLGIPNPCMA
jgi:hypothetical protein